MTSQAQVGDTNELPAHEGKAGELHFMNNARSIIISLVVLLHVALAFSDSAKQWWIIVHQGSTVIADIISGSLDIFLMPTLFFISGFFAIASYKRHGALGLIKKKVRALALPWAIGVVLLNPFSVHMLNNARGIAGEPYLRTAIDYLSDYLFFPENTIQDRTTSPFFFSHYHLWYLSLLFYFFLVFALVMTIRARMRGNGEPVRPDSIAGVRLCVSATATVSAIGYSAMVVLFGESWFVASALQFQLSRLIPYICFFVCGCRASARGWFNGGLEMKRPILLLIASAALTIPYLLLLKRAQATHAPALILLCGSARYVICFGYLLGILGAARKHLNAGGPIGRTISGNSFGTYFVHLNIVIILLYLFVRNDVGPIAFQLPAVFALSLATSFALSACQRIIAQFWRERARSN